MKFIHISCLYLKTYIKTALYYSYFSDPKEEEAFKTPNELIPSLWLPKCYRLRQVIGSQTAGASKDDNQYQQQ